MNGLALSLSLIFDQEIFRESVNHFNANRCIMLDFTQTVVNFWPSSNPNGEYLNLGQMVNFYLSSYLLSLPAGDK